VTVSAAETPGTALRFAGYAALFDRRDAGRDTIRPGAFARTLAARRLESKGRLPLYWQHRPELRIGWIDEAREDARGLRVVATIDNPEGGAAAALKAGKVTGLSFGYRARDYRHDGGGRELTEIDLFEVSLVTHPMQQDARVHMIA
jgi:HK97 family phage prohead protease